MHKEEPRWIITPLDSKLTLPFLRGTPLRALEGEKMEYEAVTPNGKIKVVAGLKETFEMSKGELFEDMCEMNILNEPEVLRNLVERYRKDDIFTYIGPTLVVVNPYKRVERLFNQKILAQTRDAVLGGSLKGSPHIYMIAGKAFQGLVNGEGKQAIVISGQSGAGKTESTKYCLQMITSLSHKESHSIENKILACNPLLQAFGNSKTVRNDNSSRFGKYMQIYFGKDNTIRGANIISYLLQKSRVTSVSQSERTFHAFYALTSSKQFGVKDPTNYVYLSQSGTYTATGIDDAAYFKQINKSMDEIGFSKNEQDKIWNILAAVLELGNLDFDEKKHQINQDNPCDILKGLELNKVAKILGIDLKELEKLLVLEKKIILKQTNYKAYNRSGCISNRNTLSKALYNSVFEFIIYKVQIALNPKVTEEMGSINLLDIFGFQNFKENSLEQLCINFTNQKLLKQYNRYVFENEMVILKEDGLEKQIQDIRPPTNDDVIAMISGKLSLFSIVNDNTPSAQYKDLDMISGFQRDFGKSKLLCFDLINKNIFTVVHSQCQVTYNIDGFKLKNQDKVNSEIQSIYSKLFINENKNQAGKTLLLKFTKEIDDLVAQLSTASNHFVRCIKPNEDKVASKVIQNYMLTQVRYLGVFQTIQIRQKTFPARKTYADFVHSYQQLFESAKKKPERQAVQIILRQVEAGNRDYLLGTKRVYMNKQVDDKLNKELFIFFKVKNEKAIKIQRLFKRYKFRKNIFKNLKILVKRKNIWRKFEFKKRMNILRHSYNLVVQYSQIRRKAIEEERRRELLSKESRAKLQLEEEEKKEMEKLRQMNQVENQRRLKETEKMKVTLEQQNKPVDKTNVSLKGMFEKGEDLDESTIVESGQKNYKRLVRPVQEEVLENNFNQSFTEGNSVYYSQGTGIIFERTIQIDMYSGKGVGNIEKLQKILAEQYKLEINGNQEEFFSPNSVDCNFQLEDTPLELLNQIICFNAGEFFKKVLRKRTTFLGLAKDYRDVLVAKNRPMNKSLTLMDEELDQQKALKVFKVIVRIGEEAKLDNVFRLIENMISLCQSTSQQLKNEVFLQLVKQSNTSHELASIRIYQSLAVYLHIYVPDQDFIMAGLYIFHKKLQEGKSSDKEEEYLRYLFKKMLRKIENPPIIGYMPIKYQMMALMCKRQISIPVYLPVGNSILVRVESYDTFSDIKARVLSQFGLDSSRLRPELFRFFEIVNFENEQLEESPINENQIVWDIMTYWELAKQKYKEANSPPPAFFLMLKVVYCFEVQPDDVEAVELCFAQCYFDYFIGRIRLDFQYMSALAACVKRIKLPNRPENQILGSYPIWMAKKHDKADLASAMIQNLRYMQKEKLDIFQMKFRFLQVCDLCPLAMSMAIPTDQPIKLFFKPKKIYLTEKGEVKQQFAMRNIVKWAIDKEKFVFDIKGGSSTSHAIFTEYASVCSQFLSELPKFLRKSA